MLYKVETYKEYAFRYDEECYVFETKTEAEIFVQDFLNEVKHYGGANLYESEGFGKKFKFVDNFSYKEINPR